nr:PH domain-containing protein [Angustibacter aerolatus]
MRLSLLREDDAQALRNTLLARAAGVTYEGGVAPEAPEREPLGAGRPHPRVAGAQRRHPGDAGAAARRRRGHGGHPAAGRAGRAGAHGHRPGQRHVGPLRSAFGFRVATSPDGLRLHHGLLTARSQTVPPGRVQAVRVSQPLLWRGRDWWRLQVNVAGYGGGSDKEDGAAAENVLLTVGSREEALEVLGLAFASLAAPDADVLAAGLTGRAGRGADGGFVGSPRSARWLDPVTWRRHGVRVTDDVLLLRRGVLTRQARRGAARPHPEPRRAAGAAAAPARPGRLRRALDPRAGHADRAPPRTRRRRPAARRAVGQGARRAHPRQRRRPRPVDADLVTTTTTEPFSLDDPAFVADPYPAFAAARAAAPVQWHAGLGSYVALSHAACDVVLRDRRLGRVFQPREPEAAWGTFNWLHADSILDSEPPKHTRLRRLVAAAFGRGHVERLRPRVAEPGRAGCSTTSSPPAGPAST